MKISKHVFSDEFISPLCKGAAIGSSEVADLCGLTTDEVLDGESLKLAAVALAGALERALWARGCQWTVQARRGMVFVLTDNEAVEFRRRQHKAGRKKIRRSWKGLSGIDTSKLDETAKRVHETEHRSVSAAVQALGKIPTGHHVRPSKSEKMAPPPRPKTKANTDPASFPASV